MTKLDASQAQCWVLTYKEGLLSPLAHDLKLAIGGFELDIDFTARTVEARFDASSLRVDCALHSGQPAPELLSVYDCQKIEQEIRASVLESDRYPEIRFRSTQVTDRQVTGLLTLHGCQRTVSFPIQNLGERHLCEVDLHQPDFHIRPYRAFLGTLRIAPIVRVVVSVPTQSPET